MALNLASHLAAQSLTLKHLTVPKTRRPKFELQIRILDLNNVPLVSGTSFIKWHLPSSQAAEHRGRTSKCSIKDHKVMYDYDKSLTVRLVIGKNKMLQETWIHFEVLQEYSSGGRGERIVLGNIKLNLAEYVEASEHTSSDGEPGVTRRYLMQDSKINSTLKIGIFMKHIEGDKDYYAPPLRTAPVFGGIAGIMSQEVQEAADDLGHMPSLSSKSRETGELQDMYRKTLAASWAAQPGELKADECIEDIFAGGDGWGSHISNGGSRTATATPVQGGSGGDDSGSHTDESKRRNASNTNLSAPGTVKSRKPVKAKPNLYYPSGSGGDGTRKGGLEGKEVIREGYGKPGSVLGRGSLAQQAKKIGMSKSSSKRQPVGEVDEFEIKDDLRSWRIREAAPA